MYAGTKPQHKPELDAVAASAAEISFLTLFRKQCDSWFLILHGLHCVTLKVPCTYHSNKKCSSVLLL